MLSLYLLLPGSVLLTIHKTTPHSATLFAQCRDKFKLECNRWTSGDIWRRLNLLINLQYKRVQRSPLSPLTFSLHTDYNIWNVGPILYEDNSSLSIYEWFIYDSDAFCLSNSLPILDPTIHSLQNNSWNIYHLCKIINEKQLISGKD